MRRVPSWFDEGLAVVASEEPTHSEQQWQTIVARGVPHPTLPELMTGDQWIDAVRKYGGEGDPKNPATGLFVVYSTAGHEVRRWFGNAGQIGLSDLIAAVEDRRDFQSAYEAAERLRAP